MFVAGFIGSPSMNFIPGKARIDTQRCRVTAEGIDLSLLWEGSCQMPQNVIIGIRPEDLSGPVMHRENTLALDVYVTEHLGHSLMVHGHCGNCTITASLEPHQEVDRNTTIRLGINLDNVHLFDPNTQMALT